MNLILFDEPFERVRLDGADARAKHIRDILRAGPGALVYLGFVDGPRARARVEVLDGGALELKLVATEPTPPPLPLTLLVALPRPHAARRILFEAASLGLEALHFFPAEKSRPSYADSRLWRGGEWRERLRSGAEQGFTTRLPVVAHHADLKSAFDALPPELPRVALDNYEAGGSVDEALPAKAAGAVLALGPEGGWSAGERDAFRAAGWTLAHLGPHVLRVETACTAAVAAAAARLGLWQEPTRTSLCDKPKP